MSAFAREPINCSIGSLGELHIGSFCVIRILTIIITGEAEEEVYDASTIEAAMTQLRAQTAVITMTPSETREQKGQYGDNRHYFSYATAEPVTLDFIGRYRDSAGEPFYSRPARLEVDFRTSEIFKNDAFIDYYKGPAKFECDWARDIPEDWSKSEKKTWAKSLDTANAYQPIDLPLFFTPQACENGSVVYDMPIDNVCLASLHDDDNTDGLDTLVDLSVRIKVIADTSGVEKWETEAEDPGEARSPTLDLGPQPTDQVSPCVIEISEDEEEDNDLTRTDTIKGLFSPSPERGPSPFSQALDDLVASPGGQVSDSGEEDEEGSAGDLLEVPNAAKHSKRSSADMSDLSGTLSAMSIGEDPESEGTIA
jgi:hypothetical protein